MSRKQPLTDAERRSLLKKHQHADSDGSFAAGSREEGRGNCFVVPEIVVLGLHVTGTQLFQRVSVHLISSHFLSLSLSHTLSSLSLSIFFCLTHCVMGAVLLQNGMRVGDTCRSREMSLGPRLRLELRLVWAALSA